jgi:hypothetical protein
MKDDPAMVKEAAGAVTGGFASMPVDLDSVIAVVAARYPFWRNFLLL